MLFLKQNNFTLLSGNIVIEMRKRSMVFYKMEK